MPKATERYRELISVTAENCRYELCLNRSEKWVIRYYMEGLVNDVIKQEKMRNAKK